MPDGEAHAAKNGKPEIYQPLGFAGTFGSRDVRIAPADHEEVLKIEQSDR